MNKQNMEIDITIKIPFFDVDSMGVAWHGNYAKYLEIARCALMDKIGYNYNQMRDNGHAWPIVTLKVKYMGSLYFEQEININAKLMEYENCIKIKYVITDLKTGVKLTKAETTQIAIDLKTHETCYVSPGVLLDKFK
jgi:acyl-CoA thioester hydrolase